MSDLNAESAQYESYWSGIRALQGTDIALQGAGTFLTTSNEDGQYLTVRMTDAQYAAALGMAAGAKSGLVRISYVDSTSGQRVEILGYLRSAEHTSELQSLMR